MNYYPVFLDLKGRRVLVVGAGKVAAQKIRQLLECEAAVHVVSPQALPAIKRLARDGRITWSSRACKTADMRGVRLVIAATDDRVLQEKISKEARGRGIWANVVDVPPLCDFIAPAVVSRGDIRIAISTGGAAPALAKYLRKKLEAVVGREYADFAAVVGSLRPSIRRLPRKRRAAFWMRAVSDSFFDDIKRHGIAKAERRLKEWIYGQQSL